MSGTNLIVEFKKANQAPFILGSVITIYELGFILAYRAGFNASELSAITTVILLFVMMVIGALVFKEHVTLKMVVGIIIATIGVLISKI